MLFLLVTLQTRGHTQPFLYSLLTKKLSPHSIYCRKLLQASIRANKTGHFIWIGSDSWGAKAHPVREQEYAAVNTITVLPQRTNLEGKTKTYLLFIYIMFICTTSELNAENTKCREFIINDVSTVR